MRLEFGSRTEDIHAAIGRESRSVRLKLARKWKTRFIRSLTTSLTFPQRAGVGRGAGAYPMLFMNQRAPGHGDPCIKLHLDLREANRRQLLAAGVPEANITVLTDCTFCQPRKFFSHSGGKRKNRTPNGACGHPIRSCVRPTSLQLKAERLVASLPARTGKTPSQLWGVEAATSTLVHSAAAIPHVAPAGCDDAHRGWFSSMNSSNFLGSTFT